MASLVLQTATVDLTFLKVSRGGRTEQLTEHEGALLRYFVANPQRDLTREELLLALGHRGSALRAVDITITRLRKKLGEPRSPNHIRTVRGLGYRFVVQDVPAEPAVLRARPLRAPIRVQTGQIDLDRRLFLPLQGEPVPLGRIDTELLERLSSGVAVPRERLVREIWGVGQHQRSLTAALRRLRERLGDGDEEPKILVALPGSAVRLERLERWESRTNLQPPKTSFVERPEIESLTASPSRGLITVRGPAGIGKTRLAIECGLRHLAKQPEGEVWFCDLSCALAERGILRAIETALGIDRTSGESERGTAERIVRVLSRKPQGTLLILDNFDQVTDHASVLEEWLQRAPHVSFIATSRHALGLPEERVLSLEPLDVASAAQLFVDRAPQGTELSPRDASVRALVQRLDGNPLSIELAAARAADFTPEELLGRLSDRLSWLVRPPEGAVSPHRSLRSALDWSWDLLEDEELRVAFAECAVFARAFACDLASAILCARRPERTLEALADRSLLQRTDGGFVMLEGIREYAREKAILLGKWEGVAGRHATVCLSRALIAADSLQGATLLASLGTLRALRGELLSIRTTAPLTQHRVEAAVALCALLKSDGPRELAAVVCDDALALGPPSALAWRLWLARSEISRLSGERGRAETELQRAAEAAQEAGSTAPAIVQSRLAHALIERGEIARAEVLLDAARSAFRAGGDRGREAAVLRSTARGLSMRGRHSEALAVLEEVEGIVRETGDPLRLYYVYRDLYQHYFARGDLDRAEEALTASLARARELSLRRAELDGLRSAAQIARYREDYLGSAALLGSAARGYEATGDDALARLMRRNQALVSIEAGLLREAESLLVESCRSPERDALRVIDLGNLAIVWHLQGKLEAAIQSLRRLLSSEPSPEMTCGLLAHLAAALADSDELTAASAAMEEARRMSRGGDPLVEMLDHTLLLARARADTELLREAVERARAAIRAATSAEPARPSPVQRDQDLNFARLVVEGALAKTLPLATRASA